MTSKTPESTANRGAVPLQNEFTRSVPDVQLVLTQLRTLAGINHFDANFLPTFTTTSEKNHMQDGKGWWIASWMSLSPNSFNAFYFSSVGTNSSTWGAGNGFPGLKCSTIDTWNYWWIPQWSQSEKMGCRSSKNLLQWHNLNDDTGRSDSSRYDQFLCTLWFLKQPPVLFPIALWRPLKCDKW